MNTVGEERVIMFYTELTPEQKAQVPATKKIFADLIDKVNETEGNARLKALVMTKLEDACMYYIKFLTNP